MREWLGPRLPPLPVYLLGLAFVLVGAAAALVTPADADLWGHLTFGRDIVATGTAVQVDTYSFTSDRPWINHEWIAEVTTYLTYHRAGAVGLIVLKLAFIAATLGIVMAHLRRAGLRGRALMVALTLVFVGTYWRTHTVRPQLFSVLLFALLLAIIARADAGRPRMLLALPVVMGFWANVHGGWIVGLGVLALWGLARLLDSRVPRGLRTGLAVVALLSLLATLVNPFGVELWRFLAETVRLDRADIEEWRPVTSSPIALGLPWLLTAVAAGLTVRRAWGRIPHAYIVIVGVLAVASFRVSRLDAFFSLAAVMLLGPALNRVWPATEWGQAPNPRGAGLVAVAATAAMLVPGGILMAPYASCLSMPAGWLPERESGVFLTQAHLRGRMLTWFDWGEYAIWHLGPDIQVSFDGRRETVYTARTMVLHRQFYDGQDDPARPLLTALQPDYIWLPNRLPVVSSLPAKGWHPIFEGPISTVFAKTAAATPGVTVASRSAATERRCFPGP